MSLQEAADQTRTEQTLLVPWFFELADCTGQAAGLAPELRFALMLATADRAMELGTALRAELDRVRDAEEHERKVYAAKVAREKRRILKSRQARFVAHIGQLVPREELEGMSPTELADVMSARWSDFAPMLAARVDELAAWIQVRLGAPAARDFATCARPSQSDGDRVLANFVVEFGSPHAQVFHGVTMTSSSISDAASIEPARVSKAYVEFSAALYRSGLIDSFAKRDSELAAAAIAWRANIEKWIALGGEGEPPPEALASLLALAVEPAFAITIAETARDAVGRTRGTGVPEWATIGESPVGDLLIAAAATEWESTRLSAVRELLESHGLLAKGKAVPKLATLAKLFGKHWDLALDVIRGPEVAVLAEYVSAEGGEFPERLGRENPVWEEQFPGAGWHTATWDRYLAEVIVALDPHGRPRFMGKSISRRDLVDFLGTSSVFVGFWRLPSSALETRLRANWADEYTERAARLFASGVMTVYSVLPGQAELGTLDELWHAHAKNLHSFFAPAGRQFWLAVLLRCIGTAGLAERVGELAALGRTRGKRHGRFVAGRSLVEDLAIIANHDRAVASRGWGQTIGISVAVFLLAWLIFFVVSWVIGAIVVLFDVVRLQTVVNVAALIGVGAGILVGLPTFLIDRSDHRAKDWALRE